MTGLSGRIVRVPGVVDIDRAKGVLRDLPNGLATGQVGELLEGVAGSSLYLSRLITRHSDWLSEVISLPPEQVMKDLGEAQAAELAAMNAIGDVGKCLRQTKSRGALLIAMADLSGAWELEETTEALTSLADAAVLGASKWLLSREIARGKLPGLSEEDIQNGAGYVILAMGKMGAKELNYSSDIDLIALFDEERFAPSDVLDARARYIAITRDLVKLLSENTGEGYVFRTDLRLRPAPSTTPVCMAMEAAERYYESVGRTWERAAHIKARALGDVVAGKRYLAALEPFIWRRHLDFAAIEDTQIMLRKIREQKIGYGRDAVRGRNLKLGPGGIREIEFFAQTRQLIFGGRNALLRAPTTLGALAALSAEGLLDDADHQTLAADYRSLRMIENRLQMIEDAQTHVVPKSDESFDRLAALCAKTSPADLENDLATIFARVHKTCTEFFQSGDTRTSKGALADASAIKTTTGQFSDPERAGRVLEKWHEGGIAATRSERARALFLKLEPQILTRLSGASNPDTALVHFDRFLSGLPAGVQLFSLFTANPALLDLIVEICTAAPRLAVYLARHSQTLDALLDRSFWEPLPEIEALQASLKRRLDEEDDYERILDATRSWAREQRFRVGVQILRGIANAPETGQAFTRIAETCIASLLPCVIAEFSRRHGDPPGNGMAVLAMGKLGSGEMTERSDLDLITVYDSADAEMSEGPRPLAPQVYYPRLTQSLVSALTAPTAQGVLYEVDMRLRPSGRQGPVAVSLSAFANYQKKEAWVWEHMALTRSRVVAGPRSLLDSLETVAAEALAMRAGRVEVLQEAREMRSRLLDVHAKDRENPWSLKLAAGGLMDMEFLAQVGVLFNGLKSVRKASEALPGLVALNWLSQDDAEVIEQNLLLHQLLQHIERIALETKINVSDLGGDLKDVLARLSGSETFEDLEARLIALQTRCAEIVSGKLS